MINVYEEKIGKTTLLPFFGTLARNGREEKQSKNQVHKQVSRCVK